MNVRTATSRDRQAVHAVHVEAFPESESAIVANLATDLLEHETALDTLSLVAERDGSIVGHVAFSPVAVEGKQQFKGCILTPLGVITTHQKSGVGRALIEEGLRRLSEQGVAVVFVYGDPDYYGRFGFSAEAARGYNAPYPLQYPFGWQARVLEESDLIEFPVTVTCVAPLSDPDLW